MTFGPPEPFDIDNGELADVPPDHAFVLGVEWGLVRASVLANDDFHAHPIHTQNQRRIAAMLSRAGYSQQWELHDDWCYVTTGEEP
jgi:hypothetical protein